MRICSESEIRAVVHWPEIIDLMGDALRAQAASQCITPMPMHIEVPAEKGEAHIKGSYRHGGEFFALKIATTFPNNATRGMSTGNGLMFLCSASTGAPVALLQDAGTLTDVRTAAVTAMVTRALGCKETRIGILGAGIQARLQAIAHNRVMPLRAVSLWGRNRERAAQCAQEIEQAAGVSVDICESPAEVARQCRVIVTCTASRVPLLHASEVQPGTHIAAVGSDSRGKQELDPAILRNAALLLADSIAQCEKLGELQHCPDEAHRVVEMGAFRGPAPASGVTVADFTGLGVEDLYIAEYCWRKLNT